MTVPKKILNIVPVVNPGFNQPTIDALEECVSPGIELTFKNPEWGGIDSLEGAYYIAVTTPYLVDLIIQAEQDGYDAVISHCFGSPGIPEGRELVKIPVVGAGEAAFYVAMMCGDRLGVVTVGGTYRTPSHGALLHLVRKMVREYAIAERVVSIRTTGLCVEDCADEAVLFDALLREAEKSIDDGAEVIILGCTGMIGMAEKLQAKLEAPVVDPSLAALKFAELLISMNLTHSKLTLPSPDMIGVKCEMKWPPTVGRWPRGG